MWTRAGFGFGHIRPCDGFCACGSTRQRSHFKHASSLRLFLRLHRLAIDTHSLVMPIFRHISPQISLPTTIGSPRVASTRVACRIEDGEVGLSTTALSDKEHCS